MYIYIPHILLSKTLDMRDIFRSHSEGTKNEYIIFIFSINRLHVIHRAEHKNVIDCPLFAVDFQIYTNN